MLTIKNSKELAKHLTKDKDLIVDEDVRIEYQVQKGELRDVKCYDLFLMNDTEQFDFNGGNFTGGDFTGRDFNGGNFNGWDFNGWDFNGWDFNGWDFNGWDFNGGNFTGKRIYYWAFFDCYGSIKCTSIEARSPHYAEPVCLDGKIEIVEDNSDKKAAILRQIAKLKEEADKL